MGDVEKEYKTLEIGKENNGHEQESDQKGKIYHSMLNVIYKIYINLIEKLK